MMRYYLLFNIGIASGYSIARLLLALPLLRHKLTQAQQLYFIRFCFVLAPALLLSMPGIAALYPNANSSFEFKPIIIHAAKLITSSEHAAAVKFAMSPAPATQLSLLGIASYLLISGIIYQLIRYLKQQYKLFALSKQGYCRHKIRRVRLFFTDHISMPFCFAFGHQHYIMMPTHLLAKTRDLKLALRHELQHIRQHDTVWLQAINIIKLICFWNPLFWLWLRWAEQAQEFACDETLILRQGTATTHYAQCLIDAARAFTTSSSNLQGVIGINQRSSILTRRVTMLFNYKKLSHKLLLGLIYTGSSLLLAGAALATDAAYNQPITAKKLAQIIKKTAIHPEFHVTANKEVVQQINNIRNSSKAREQFTDALTRMKKYQSTIEPALRDRNMPLDLMTIPFVESGYRPLKESENPMRAAGIWQFIPETAKNYGLTINSVRDDRLDTTLSTDSALYFLQKLHTQFNDWKLAAMAYEIGEKETQRLIDATKSRDAWTIARSKHVPKSYKKELINYLAALDASMIIMHDKKLIAG